MSPHVDLLWLTVMLLTHLTPGGAYPTSHRHARSAIDNSAVRSAIFPAGYNFRKRPNYGLNTTVLAVLDVASISHINEKEKAFTVTGNLTLFWNDTRLRAEKETSLSIIEIKDMWLPHITIKKVVKQPVNPQPLDRDGMTEFNTAVLLSPGGKVKLQRDVDATLSFDLELHNYPNDQQECEIEFEVDRHKSRAVDLKLDIVSKKRRNVTAPSTFDVKNYGFGKRNNLTVVVEVKRDMSNQHLQLYLPCYLIVVLSWIPVYTPYKPATRIKLSFMAVLTMMTFATGYRSTLPKTKHVKLIDAFLLFCISTVWFALFSTLLITWCSKDPNTMKQETKCCLLCFECKKIKEPDIKVDESDKNDSDEDDDDDDDDDSLESDTEHEVKFSAATKCLERICACPIRLLKFLSAVAPVIFLILAALHHYGMGLSNMHTRTVT